MLRQPIDQEVQARRALGKVYALLCRLADEKQEQESLDGKSPSENSQVTALQDAPLIDSLDQNEY